MFLMWYYFHVSFKLKKNLISYFSRDLLDQSLFSMRFVILLLILKLFMLLSVTPNCSQSIKLFEYIYGWSLKVHFNFALLCFFFDV